MKLLVVTVSVRDSRVGTKITDWFVKRAKKDGHFEVDVVDLKELNLPYELASELAASVQNFQYERQEDRDWSARVRAADAIVFVSPEYNHGYAASLKNAVDHLYHEWNNKPTAFVGYGSAGAPFAHAAFGLVAAWLKLDLIGPRVGISEIWAAFDEKDNLQFEEYYNHEAELVLRTLVKKVEAKQTDQ